MGQGALIFVSAEIGQLYFAEYINGYVQSKVVKGFLAFVGLRTGSDGGCPEASTGTGPAILSHWVKGTLPCTRGRPPR
jgi:hypothetical protein